jgi:methyl-accepting chemotaxis protein
MEEINHANEKLEEINRVIEEINEKTKVINDIVAETRMLSFNASIEAARAGEHGRGFAVVAEQIGNLAKMSGKAAQEIRMLIAKSTSQVNQSINFTQDKVKAGQKISEDCAMAFNKIAENIRHLSPLVNAIATAASQQETGISQTNRAMQQMDVVTNKNLKRASEAAQAGKKLRGAVWPAGKLHRRDEHHPVWYGRGKL